jgi:hypothetical protein
MGLIVTGWSFLDNHTQQGNDLTICFFSLASSGDLTAGFHIDKPIVTLE